jgi:hypothetical protein
VCSPVLSCLGVSSLHLNCLAVAVMPDLSSHSCLLLCYLSDNFNRASSFMSPVVLDNWAKPSLVRSRKQMQQKAHTKQTSALKIMRLNSAFVLHDFLVIVITCVYFSCVYSRTTVLFMAYTTV